MLTERCSKITNLFLDFLENISGSRLPVQYYVRSIFKNHPDLHSAKLSYVCLDGLFGFHCKVLIVD